MQVLQVSNEVYNTLNGWTNCTARLEFAIDGNGNYIIGTAVLDLPEFASIRDQLAALPLIDYVSPIPAVEV